jgi:hypothetical protein
MASNARSVWLSVKQLNIKSKNYQSNGHLYKANNISKQDKRLHTTNGIIDTTGRVTV